MNELTHRTALELEAEFGDIPDELLAGRIGEEGQDSWKMLFYLLFARYAGMLVAIFHKYAASGLDFDDFMLELHVKMGKNNFAAVRAFNGSAQFKTYLSTIARNLLFDIGKREKPSIDIDTVHDLPCEDDYEREQMGRLLELINAYPDETARFILFKTIEGYSSKEIAIQLTAMRGTEVKPSYVDTLRSRTYRKLRSQVQRQEARMRSMPMPRMAEAMYDMDAMAMPEFALESPASVSLSGRYTILPALREILWL